MKKIAVIGGGITGLATAYYLQRYSHGTLDVTLIDSAPRFGGKITSAIEGGFVVEGGPDSFITKKAATLELCGFLGLDEQLLPSNSSGKTTYVWSRGDLRPMPEGMLLMAPTMVLPFLRSNLISWPGKLRMGMEMLIPPQAGEQDESLAGFVRRRLGAEALEKIAGPLMAGIHAADPETLSLRSTFPMFLEMEKKYGGLLRGVMLQKRAQQRQPGMQGAKQKHSPMFMTLRGGLQQLVDGMLAELRPEALLLNRRVLGVGHDRGRFEISLEDGLRLAADEVVFATPAYATADLLQEIDPALASRLRSIRYVSTATVSLGFRQGDLKRPLNGSGFVVPRSEKRRITACSWSSTKFNHRAPADCALIRVFVGGALAEDLAEMDDAALVDLARQELRATMGISAEPVLAKAYRWPKGNPQYEVGHQERVAEIDRMIASHPGLHLAGAAYHGAGVPDCVASGAAVAQAIAIKHSINMDGYYDRSFSPTLCAR
ncbi:MAG: protoporphyrinogen oxidase [Acidobacteriaceae bacterium]